MAKETDGPGAAYRMRSANSTLEDSLGLAGHREAFQLIVTTADPPATVGLYGRWGTGKTSFMRQVAAELEQQGYPTVWFDLWEHERNPEPAVAMLNVARQQIVEKLRKQVREHQDKGWRRADLIRAPRNRWEITRRDNDLREKIEALMYGVVASPSLSVGSKDVVAVNIENPTTRVHQRFDELRAERFRVLDEHTRLRGQFDTAIGDLRQVAAKLRGEQDGPAPPDDRIVFFIDDLDRCPPKVMIDLLEQIRLFIDREQCVFVVGVDDDVVVRAVLRERPDLVGLPTADHDSTPSAEDQPDPVDEARRYLEKMIQYPFTLPPLGEQMMKSFVTNVLGQTKIEQDVVGLVSPILVDVLNERHDDSMSLRVVVRLVNALVLNHLLTKKSLKGATYDPRVTAVVTLVQHVYNTTFKAFVRMQDGGQRLYSALTGLASKDGQPESEWSSMLPSRTSHLRRHARDLKDDKNNALDAATFAQYIELTAATAQTVTSSRSAGRAERHAEWYLDSPELGEKAEQHRKAGTYQETRRWLADPENRAEGQVVTVGRYPWRVLQIKDGTALLLSEYVVGRCLWHDEHDDVRWSDDPWLRRQLRETFLPTLGDEMLRDVLRSSWARSDNRWFRRDSGGDTEEKISFLSIEEVKSFMPSEEERVAVDLQGGRAWWWLRSPGGLPDSAARVRVGGDLGVTGGNVSVSSGGVRPVLRLNLES